MAEGTTGYCGIRQNVGGKITQQTGANTALAYMYLDPLPTNCCAAWFCTGSQRQGYNLAVFFYGCNFDCLFCQNASHKQLTEASQLSAEQLIEAALDSRVQCICFFGGSPEPHLPFTIRVARRILEASSQSKPVCWEWNGCGHPKLVIKAAELAAQSGGTIKFDLKAYHPHVVKALCGVDNREALENFTTLAQKFPRNSFLTATTLLVPYYVDRKEVENIARFISSLDRDIPYSLLIFHPEFYIRDLPITPRAQVRECLEAAQNHLNRVNLGNQHLLQFSD
ncbi:MAG: radical SAM protein [Calditrichia bacterium]